MITPREYQIEALEAVDSLRLQGINRQLISLPTGCGKTVIFSLLAKELNVRTLVIAHTEELISQAVSKFKTVWEDVDIGIVKAKSDEVSSHVVIASIQTASKPKRLSRLKEQNFGLLIIDEAHHATALSYHKVIEELGFFVEHSSKLLVGVTATPKRSDGVGLRSVFQEIAFDCSMSTMIRSGYLSPLVGMQVFTKVELSRVGTSKGDFIASQLANVVNTTERNQLIVDNYLEYAADREKTLAFCVNVQHAKDLAAAFKDKGIEAEAVYGALTREERSAVLQNFSKGKYKVLTNCQILTEGFDDPSIDCILMGRPTQSTSLFTQMIGRGTRTFPLKKNCFILDFTDNASKHSLCTYKNTLDGAVASLFELESIDDNKEGKESSKGEIPCPQPYNAVKILEERVEEISFFDNVHFAWTPVQSSWHLSLGVDREVWVVPFEDGYYVKAYKDKELYLLSKRKIPLNYALGIAEDWARRQTTRSAWARKDAVWRGEPATQKQKDALCKMGISFEEGISKGRASQLLDSRLNEPATIKQLYWLKARGISFNDTLSKREARRLIAENAKK